MNCIFVTIFNNENYIKMFYLFLESVYISANLNDNTDILIYTCTDFMNIIKSSHLFSNKIKFEINDTYNNITKACKARLDLFNLNSISNYDKILYLDTDILITKDINVLFDIAKDNCLYTMKEGMIDQEWWGLDLFGDEINNYENKEAFSSGIMLFKNHEKIKNLFDKINEDIVNRPYDFVCHDQPYIVYNAFKYNLYNNIILNDYCAHISSKIDIFSDKIVLHFSGGPGLYAHKLFNMASFLNPFKEHVKNNMCITKAKDYVNNYLIPIIVNSKELLEGNIFTYHHTLTYNDQYSDKAKNICSVVLNNSIKKVLEIGFNSGFSALLMLLSNPNIILTCCDIGEYKYVLPCYEKLKETFGDRINIIIGNSVETLKNIDETYDLIHIDGGHSTDVAENDIINSYRLSRNGTIIIMNDYNFANLHPLWDKYCNDYNLKNLDIVLKNTPFHNIKYVCNK
jgi:hypothetical protein